MNGTKVTFKMTGIGMVIEAEGSPEYIRKVMRKVNKIITAPTKIASSASPGGEGRVRAVSKSTSH
jgi:hypothetical protein